MMFLGGWWCARTSASDVSTTRATRQTTHDSRIQPNRIMILGVTLLLLSLLLSTSPPLGSLSGLSTRARTHVGRYDVVIVCHEVMMKGLCHNVSCRRKRGRVGRASRMAPRRDRAFQPTVLFFFWLVEGKSHWYVRDQGFEIRRTRWFPFRKVPISTSRGGHAEGTVRT